MNKPLVSITIPCYNDADYITQCVESAYKQTYSNIEIIVVDDGSDAKTKKVLSRIRDKIDTLIIQENKGVVFSRNTAIEAAKGKYILTLDSDDFFDSDFLKKAVRILEGNDRVGMVTCWTALIDESEKEIGLMKPSGAPASEAIFFNNAPACLLFRRICWEEVGGYDYMMVYGDEDWEFNVSVCEKGWIIEVIPEVLFSYRQKKVSRNKIAKQHRKNSRRYAFNKHKELLTRDFRKTIDFFLEEIESRENSRENVKNSPSYKLGNAILEPLRRLKYLFK